MSDKLLSLKVLSPDRIILNADNITSINVRLEDGDLIGIRPGHTPMIALTSSGKLAYKNQNADHNMTINAGILSVEKNLVRILTTGAAEIIEQEKNTTSTDLPLDSKLNTYVETLPNE